MAEAVLRHKVKQQGLDDKIIVDSAGTGHWHVGEPPHRGTRAILKAQNINCEGLIARQIKPSDLVEFDYILAMDEQNVRDLKRIAPAGTEHKIKLLLQFLPEAGNLNVPDPYFTGNFEEVYELIDKSCEELLKTIRSEIEG